MRHKDKLALLIILIFLTGCSRLETVQEVREEKLLLNKDKPVGQSFVAKNNSLNMIKVWVNNPNLSNNLPLVFHLKREGEKEDLVKIEFSGSNVGAFYWLPLKFPPISDSAGETFYFFIEQLAVSEREKSLEFSQSTEDVYMDGDAFLNHQPLKGDLTFRSYYWLRPQRFWLVSLQEFWQRFLSDLPFAIFYLSSILVLLVLTVKFSLR